MMQISPTNISDVFSAVGNLDESCVELLLRVFPNESVLNALSHTVLSAKYVWSIKENYDLLAILGVTTAPEFYVPWVLKTDKAEGKNYTLCKMAKKFVRTMDDKGIPLMNTVDVGDNTTAKWLEWLGYKKVAVIDDPFKKGSHQTLYTRACHE